MCPTKVLILVRDELLVDVYERLVRFFLPDVSLDVALSPDDGLETFRRKNHAIVMSDQNASLEDGLIWAAKACVHKKDLVIIFITADTAVNETKIDSGLPEACTYFVVHKPISAKELRAALMRALMVISKNYDAVR